MSRIGSKPIEIPENVEIESNQGSILVKGPKGSIEIRIDNRIEIKLEDNLVMLERKNDEPSVRSLHGLYRSLIYNNIVGVTEGFTKTLELQGVGFKAILKGNDLELSVGYSHTVLFKGVEGIDIKVPDQNSIIIEGIDKGLVGQVAANIRAVKPPEPYKGKGIRYQGEYVRRKAGKAAIGTEVGAGA
mgnify:CR=1 FL=1|tara:strand:- start:311 stop:871 length:561 start_codon:yes stop_codon:yes gene_type:complete